MRRVRAAAAAAALLLPAAVPATARPSLDGARRWACFYGKILSRQAQEGLDLLIADPEAFQTPAGPALRLAYINGGEIDESQALWPALSSAAFIVEPNPDWPGAHRVDLRAAAWSELVLSTMIPAALAKGYAGVMFDTLDTAPYLEDKDPARFAGSAAAAAAFVREARRRFPEALIVVNNAFYLLAAAPEALDGVLVEDLYTRCRPEPGECGPTPEPVAREKEALLARFRAATGKPVFVLHYSGPSRFDERWVKAALRRARRKGFLSYLAAPALTTWGRVAPDGAP